MPDKPFTTRPTTEADLPAIASLVRELNIRAGSSLGQEEERLRVDWNNPKLDPAKHTLLAEVNGEIAGFGFVFMEPPQATTSGFTTADQRGKGIGTELLNFAVDTASRGGNDELLAWTPSAETESIQLLKNNGFDHVRSFFQMVHPSPGEIAEPTLPANIKVESIGGEDRLWMAKKAHDDSFIDHWNFRPIPEDQIAHWFNSDPNNGELWFIATEGAELAGLCLCRLSPDENDQPRGNVSILGTTRPYRGIGLGRALLEYGIWQLASREAHEVTLGVDAENPTGALGLYERTGFKVRSESRSYRLPLR
ncbi:MAG: N-acetyltransferase family protein [Actinomycetota bacterium]|nr:GNAT family N-acetyltransferase [Actinomycetota bacterium]